MGKRAEVTIVAEAETTALAAMIPRTTDSGPITADLPMCEPPVITQREVIQTPGSMRMGRVMRAMSDRREWLPVVRNVSWEMQVSCPT
jgi:hypothetical protein